MELLPGSNSSQYLQVVTLMTSGGVSSNYQITSSQSVGVTRYGQKNPNWKQLIRQNLQAGSPYTRTEKSVQKIVADTSFDWYYGDPQYNPLSRTIVYGMVLTSGYTTLSADVALAENRARANFYKKLYATQTKFGGAVFLGELRETMKMLRNPFGTIRDAMSNMVVNQAKRLKFKKPPKRGDKWKIAEKAIADTWLEMSFGLLPLMSDAESMAEALAELLAKEHVKRFSGTGISDVGQDFPDQLGVLYDMSLWKPWYYKYRIQDSGVARIRYKGAISVGYNDGGMGPGVDKLAYTTKLFGISLTDLVPTAWELVPWSFLFDYFMNIDDVLNARFAVVAKPIWVVKSSVVTSKREVTGNFTINGTSAGMTTYTSKEFIREIPSSVEMPSLAFDVNLTPWKGLNILALRRALTGQIQQFLG